MAKRRKTKTKRKTKNRIRNRSVYKLRTRKRNKVVNKSRTKNSRKKYGGEIGGRCSINDYRTDPLQKEDGTDEWGISNTCNSRWEYCKDNGNDDVCTWRGIPYNAGWQRKLPHEY